MTTAQITQAQIIRVPTDGSPLALEQIMLIDARGKVVLRGAKGELVQRKTNASFDTELTIVPPAGATLPVGSQVRAIGITSDSKPVQSELVTLTSVDAKMKFAGSIPRIVKPAIMASTDDGADIEITFTNYATSAFPLTLSGANLQLGFGGLTTSPSGALAANAGNESIGANQALSALDEGPADIFLGFGAYYVWIHFNFQMFGIGPRPVWFVGSEGGWTPNGDDPSVPYTWATSLGFNVVARPTSGHLSLTVEVLVQDLAS